MQVVGTLRTVLPVLRSVLRPWVLSWAALVVTMALACAPPRLYRGITDPHGAGRRGRVVRPGGKGGRPRPRPQRRQLRGQGAINRQVPDGRGGTKACNTTGTATDAGYAEHAFTFDVARRVGERSSASGVRVVMTRTDDAGVGPCVDERARAGSRPKPTPSSRSTPTAPGPAPAASTSPSPNHPSTPRSAGRVGRSPRTCGTRWWRQASPGRATSATASRRARTSPGSTRYATDRPGGVREHAEPGRSGTGVVGSRSGPLRRRHRRRGPAVPRREMSESGVGKV